MSTIALDELEACFYAGKRHQIEQRRTEEILRDDTTESTPPLSACGRRRVHVRGRHFPNGS
ncbi:DUF6191 domain-containing protein [Frankia sp. EAN1pec]|uniref:DUF6191 domain-containing protein n=1 Tax=Parafrankia sp. (strain EAN1pec) TaxID=298653 RepID=UPI0002FC3BDF